MNPSQSNTLSTSVSSDLPNYGCLALIRFAKVAKARRAGRVGSTVNRKGNMTTCYCYRYINTRKMSLGRHAGGASRTMKSALRMKQLEFDRRLFVNTTFLRQMGQSFHATRSSLMSSILPVPSLPWHSSASCAEDDLLRSHVSCCMSCRAAAELQMENNDPARTPYTINFISGLVYMGPNVSDSNMWLRKGNQLVHDSRYDQIITGLILCRNCEGWPRSLHQASVPNSNINLFLCRPFALFLL